MRELLKAPSADLLSFWAGGSPYPLDSLIKTVHENSEDVLQQYGMELTNEVVNGRYNATAIAVTVNVRAPAPLATTALAAGQAGGAAVQTTERTKGQRRKKGGSASRSVRMHFPFHTVRSECMPINDVLQRKARLAPPLIKTLKRPAPPARKGGDII